MNLADTSDTLAVPMPHGKSIADIPVARLYEILIWLAFVSLIAPDSDAFMGPGMRRILIYSSYLCGISLIALSFRQIVNIGEYARINPGYWLLVSMMLICFSCTCIGILSGGSEVIQYLFLDSLIPYGAAVLMLPPASKDTRDRLVITFQRQVLAASFFSVYAIHRTQMSGMMIAFNRDAWYDSFEKSAFTMLGLLPFLAGYAVGKRRLKTVLIVAFGYLMFIVLSLRGANRSSLVVAFVVIPFCVLAVYWKGKGLLRVSFFMAKSLIVIVVFFVVIRIVAPSLISGMNLGVSAAVSMYRFTETYDVSSVQDVKSGVESSVTKEAQFSRGAEAEDFVNSLEFPEHVIGKGFGIKWYSSFWGKDWPLVHIGPLHLVYKGGFVLLVTYYLLFLFTVIRSWKYSDSDPVAMGCFVFLIAWIARFHLYGPQEPDHSTYVFWLIVGMALSCGSRQKRHCQT